MVEKEYTISQELEEKTSKPMEWQQVLFLQVNRINEAMTKMDGNFMAGIDALEMDLAFFSERDKLFKKELEEIGTQANEWLNKQKQIGGHIPQNAEMAAAYARARELMKALLRLMGRAGFYPESQFAWKGQV